MRAWRVSHKNSVSQNPDSEDSKYLPCHDHYDQHISIVRACPESRRQKELDPRSDRRRRHELLFVQKGPLTHPTNDPTPSIIVPRRTSSSFFRIPSTHQGISHRLHQSSYHLPAKPVPCEILHGLRDRLKIDQAVIRPSIWVFRDVLHQLMLVRRAPAKQQNSIGFNPGVDGVLPGRINHGI